MCPWPRSFEFQSARLYGFMEESCTTIQKTKECRPTQIKTKEYNKQKEDKPGEQEIQECDNIDT